VKWVRQEDEWGCGVACLAMLTGQTYAEVAATFTHSFVRSGVDYIRCDSWLVERGYATARKFRHDHNWHERTLWPPEPWGDAHLCCVDAIEHSPRSHFVVMLADGECLDPLTPERKRLTDYHRVLNVAAVVKRPGW
jgi:hypothetical protein